MASLNNKVKVSYGKIKIPQEPNIQKIQLEDGSFKALIYDKAKTDVTVKFSEDRFYDYSSGCYRTSYRAVPSVEERKLQYVVIIIKKSEHCFKIIVASDKKTIYESAKTYDEVNAIIAPIFNKKKATTK